MAINGSVTWGIMPIWYTGGGGIHANMNIMQYGSGGNYVNSANRPLRYQVVWSGTGIDENYQATAAGDIVNIVFRVYATTHYPNPPLVDWEQIGVIRKSRDVPNQNSVDNTVPADHRFTIDIGPLVADQLSYSLVPLGKGTYQSYQFGGLNGGVSKQDNITDAQGKYAQTLNGAFRRIRVSAEAEVIQSNGTILEENISLSMPPTTAVINSVDQWDKDNPYYNETFTLQKWGSAAYTPKRLMSNCPNWSYNGTLANGVKIKKPVRPETEESSEWVYFYVSQSSPGGWDDNDVYNLYEIYGDVYDKDGNNLSNPFVLADFTLRMDLNNSTSFARNQNRVLVQNVSPSWIKNNAFDPQDSSAGGVPMTTYTTAYTWDNDTAYYRLYVRGHYYQNQNSNAGSSPCNCWVSNRHSSIYYYEIDREEACGAFDFVRFHWLNTAGGIDSYTAKKSVVEGLSISKETVERKAGDRMHWQEDKYSAGVTIPDGDYLSDSMRGGNTYKGGREVLNINAQKSNSVYTEPLNKPMAKWLSEIATSPNVWIETPTDVAADAAYHWNRQNSYLRPEATMYTPVIITNTDLQTVNEEEGLVKFNIQYTHSHKTVTQRN